MLDDEAGDAALSLGREHGDGCQFHDATTVRLELAAAKQHALRVDGDHKSAPIQPGRIDANLPDQAGDCGKILRSCRPAGRSLIGLAHQPRRPAATMITKVAMNQCSRNG